MLTGDLNPLSKYLEQHVERRLEDSAERLKKAYEENEFIEEAEVDVESGTINIKLVLTFDPVDSEEQDLVKVFEYGGVLFKGDEKEMIMIEPNFYIRRFFQ